MMRLEQVEITAHDPDITVGSYANMDYKGIRYIVRAGIERDHWIVAIHPGDIEMSGKVITGDRERAEALAHSMINKWLARHQWH